MSTVLSADNYFAKSENSITKQLNAVMSHFIAQNNAKTWHLRTRYAFFVMVAESRFFELLATLNQQKYFVGTHVLPRIKTNTEQQELVCLNWSNL